MTEVVPAEPDLGRASDGSTAPADPDAGARRRPAGRGVLLWFVGTSFLGSFLLFLIQPVVGRILLPSLGGSPAVWNTAMVFFQAVLLVGYALAHVGIRRLGVVRHQWLHLGLLVVPLASLPVALPGGWRLGGQDPVWWVLVVLVVMVGAPFLALAACSPVLQRWFSATDHSAGGDPHFLYSAGNVGSLLALLGYPVLMEPTLGLESQSRWWSMGFVVLVVAYVGCAVLVRRHPAPLVAGGGSRGGGVEDVRGSQRALRPLQLVWLSAVPSALLLGVTRHLGTDVASVPLMWVMPLAAYLVTFIVAFGSKRPERLVLRTQVLLPAALMSVVLAGLGSKLALALIALDLIVVVVGGLVAHGRLAELRPGPQQLTAFYLWISVGGVVGGATVSLLAPVIFPDVWEYPLALVVTMALWRPTGDRWWTGADRRRVLVFVVLSVPIVAVSVRSDVRLLLTLGFVAAVATLLGVASVRLAVAMVVAAALVPVVLASTDAVHQERTFFGVVRVVDNGEWRDLVHGTTRHGRQSLDPDRSQEPMTYYHRDGPLGDVMEVVASGSRPTDVGAVGLGAGTIAAYGEVGDSVSFYEIDEAVVRIATDPSLFTYISGSAADVTIALGDGRLLLEDDSGAAHDVLVIDAFSSDSIPTHLMTVEALQLYFSRLSGDGVVAFHVSNRYLDLGPVVARLASELGLDAWGRTDVGTPALGAEGASASQWVVVGELGSPVLDSLSEAAGWERAAPDGPLWTDSYSSIFGVLR